MPQHLHLDFETYSEADLKSVGAYRYALDPSTEILCAAMAIGDGEPVLWPPQQGYTLDALEPYWDALEDPETLIYAHNAQFEIAISTALMWKTWGIRCPDISRFRCTMSFARRAALPGSLGKLAEVLGLKDQKDKKGTSLIKKFCEMQTPKKPTKKNPQGIPARRIRPQDEPEAFADLLAYCQQDVRVEQEVAKRLAYFDDDLNNRNYTLHEIINARGVAVNLQALRNAQKIIEEETEVVSSQFRQLTGFEVTQNAKLLAWANRMHGYDFANLQAETVDSFLEQYEGQEDVDDVVKALRMKQSTAYASIKKVATMLECAGPHDNRIRGMLNHHGATTGRSTNSLVQFQNMKRPTIKHSEDAYREICAGISRDMLDICHGAPLEVISSCVRHFVHDCEPEEKLMHDADYAAIEARIVCWLAGQDDALQEYRDGVDRYKVMASLIYGIPVSEVNKHPQRFVGKTAILGCGFGAGATSIRKACKKMGYDMPIGLDETAVNSFRAKHRKVRSYWYDVENCSKRAIVNRGQIIKHRNIAFLCDEIGGMLFLLIKLPSGRKLAYPRPRISNDRILFFGSITGSTWGDVETYGGKLVENITQAVAADVLCHGVRNAENAAYLSAALIHDQALAYYQEGQTSQRFVELLTDLPAWAEGLPIEAEGGLVPFYKKD